MNDQITQAWAREELDLLLNDAIAMALKLIERHGSHVPFGMAMTQSGERVNVVAGDRETQAVNALAQAVLHELNAKCARREFRAVVFAVNVTYRSAVDGTVVDAIQMDLDHASGRPVTCILPYRHDNEVTPGELLAIEPVRRFFQSIILGSDIERT